jgi:hypothetical protein
MPQALPALAHLLWSSDTETVVDACWAVSYISDGPDSNIQTVLQSQALMADANVVLCSLESNHMTLIAPSVLLWQLLLQHTHTLARAFKVDNSLLATTHGSSPTSH